MPAGSNDLPPYFLYLLPVFFAAVWAISGFSISFASGWHLHSKRFRAQSETYGETGTTGPFFYHVRMQFGVLYSGALRITTAEDALYLSVLFMLRVGYAALRIPWNQIEMSKTRFLWFLYLILTFGKQETIPMRMSESMAR